MNRRAFLLGAAASVVAPARLLDALIEKMCRDIVVASVTGGIKVNWLPYHELSKFEWLPVPDDRRAVVKYTPIQPEDFYMARPPMPTPMNEDENIASQADLEGGPAVDLEEGGDSGTVTVLRVVRKMSDDGTPLYRVEAGEVPDEMGEGEAGPLMGGDAGQMADTAGEDMQDDDWTAEGGAIMARVIRLWEKDEKMASGDRPSREDNFNTGWNDDEPQPSGRRY